MHRSKDDHDNWSNGAPQGGSPGSDFLQLDTGRAPARGLSDWLAGELRDAISDGRLPLDSRLPATRALAAELRVSRGVVTEAYQRLVEDGHVVGRGRQGTVVVAAPARAPVRTDRTGRASRAAGGDGGNGGDGGDGSGRGSAGSGTGLVAPFEGQPDFAVFDALRTSPARVDLAPGVPDLAAFPRAAWLRAERAVLSELSASGLGYGDPRGTPELRAAVAHWLARNRGIRAEPEEVLIVSGTAQALGLVGQVLHADGLREMAVEDPSSLGVRQHIGRCGLRTPPVRVDTDGVHVGELRALGSPAVLLTPAHQFPMGVVLGGERRRALMRWAADEGGLIMEDDYDAEHRYDRAPVPALRSMLPEQVFYAGSVSKLLAPALRIGWLLAPPRYREALVTAKRFADLGNAALPQLVLARLMASGELERRLRPLRRRHRRRRDAMIAALARHLPGAVVHGAAAGLHLTVTFERGTFLGGPVPSDDAALATAALARGVKTQPLSWHSQRPHPPGLVLGYAARTATEIEEGVALLAKAARKTPNTP